MNGWEIAILVFVCVAFAVAVGVIIRNKIKGKSCCGDCSGCSCCSAKNKNEGSKSAACPHCAAKARVESEKQ